MAGLASYGTRKISSGGVESPELNSTLVNNYKKEASYVGNKVNSDDISISFENVEDNINREITNNMDNENAEKEKPWYKKLWEGIKSTGATVAVGATSVISGIADIGEAAVDGVAWVGGKAVEGGSWLVGEAVGLVDEDAKDDIMEWREDAKADVRDFISTDWVDEANQAFYENTSLGQAINDASYMKYDSELAQKIEGISTSVGTGATILTGGAAAPFVCGALVGIGNSAETMYQANPESSGLTELMILGTGGLNGIAWAANGKLGASFVTEFGKSLGEVGFKQTATNLGQSFTQPEFLKSWLKQSLTDKGNYISSAMMSADDVIGFFTGEKELNAENLAMVGVGFLENFGLNTLEDGVRLGIGGFKAPSTQEAVNALKAAKVEDLETTQPLPKIEDPDATQPIPIVSEETKVLDAKPIATPELTSGQKITNDYVSNLAYYQQQGISFQDYLQSLGISIKEFKTAEDVATQLGDGKLYLLDLLSKHLDDGTLTDDQSKELTDILNKYFHMSVGDIDPLDMLNDARQYMTPDQIDQALDILNFGVVEQWSRGLSENQKASIFNYTACGGFEINAYLNNTTLPGRNGTKGRRARERFSNISEIQDAVSGYPLSNNRKNRILSSADADILTELDSAISKSDYNDAIVSYRGVRNLYDASGRIDPSTLVPGVSFTTGGYQSSSILFDNNYGAKKADTNIILQIITPPHSGTAAYIESITGVTSYGQMEMLVKRNATMTVVGDVMKQVINGVEKTIVPVVVQ